MGIYMNRSANERAYQKTNASGQDTAILVKAQVDQDLRSGDSRVGFAFCSSASARCIFGAALDANLDLSLGGDWDGHRECRAHWHACMLDLIKTPTTPPSLLYTMYIM